MKEQLKILVINGPNLNLLGTREPDIYGRETLADIEAALKKHAAKLGATGKTAVTIEFRQSNSEADLISWIGAAPGVYDGIIINPAALTHTSVGVLDALKAVGERKDSEAVPSVEVHLSNTQAREDFRQRSITAGGCIGQVMGFRATSYLLALDGLLDYITRKRTDAQALD